MSLPGVSSQSVSNQDAGLSASGSPPVVRKSQRQPLSCTACTKRKTRCDKVIPCQNCIKRGKGDECHLEITVKDTPRTGKLDVVKIEQQIEGVRAAAKMDNVALQHRVLALETIIHQMLGAGSDGNSHSHSMDLLQLQHHQQLQIENNAGGLLPTGATEPDTGGEVDAEADAAATLEFLAMGRSRAKTAGALLGLDEDSDDETPEADGEYTNQNQTGGEAEVAQMPQSPLITAPASASQTLSVPAISEKKPTILSPPKSKSTPLSTQTPGGSTSASMPSSKSTRKAKKLLDLVPTEEIGREIIEYDVNNVLWMHCAYHADTFISEAEVFWTDGKTGEVEVNKSWLSLLFAVLCSGLHHMPRKEQLKLFPEENEAQIQEMLQVWFNASVEALHEANWMQNHSLYSLQVIAIIVSPANHLSKSDLYYTMLACAVRISQNLNINHLGPDPYFTKGETSRSNLILREVCKRVFWQMIVQDFFHLAFNRSCALNMRQFDTPPPLHCTEASLLHPSRLQLLSEEKPTATSHTIQLVKLAVLVYQLYDAIGLSRSPPYSLILEFDQKAKNILAEAPSWMKYDENENPNPLPPGAPAWLDWQRMAYMVSSAHKLIILHRPFLGRAFRDPKYKYSREICVSAARRILTYLKLCTGEPFRKTWTVIAHSLAASIICLLDYTHRASPTSTASNDAEAELAQVLETIAIFEEIAPSSSLAAKAVDVLSALVEKERNKTPHSLRKRKSFHDPSGSSTIDLTGKTEEELERAVKILRKSNQLEEGTEESAVSGSNTTESSVVIAPSPGTILSRAGMFDLKQMEQLRQHQISQPLPFQSLPTSSLPTAWNSNLDYTTLVGGPLEAFNYGPVLGNNVDYNSSSGSGSTQGGGNHDEIWGNQHLSHQPESPFDFSALMERYDRGLI